MRRKVFDMSGSLIKLKDITKDYVISDNNKIHALDHIDLETGEGEFVAVTGASGSGKSTLLKILGQIIEPTSGEFEFKGKKINSLSAADRALIRSSSIGFVFQEFNLIPYYSVRENIEMPLILSPGRFKRKVHKEKIDELLEMCGISEFIKAKAGNLSGGQKQRVALCRALVNDPELILADEPTGALDTENGKVVMDILKKINASGKTVILVTHNPELAAMTDRQVVLSDGKIIKDESLAVQI